MATADEPLYDQGVGDLNHLLIEHETGTSNYRGITKAHWKLNKYRADCANASCPKKFSLTERVHHCRRCGDTFCSTCVQYWRKLNNLAHPDPNGKLQKVCEKCYEEGPQNLGQTRCYMSAFKEMREKAKNNNTEISRRRSRKDRLDVQKECTRLTEGFSQSIGSSGFSKMVFDMKNTVATPSWQRSANWVCEKLCTSCCECRQNFNVTRVRHHCAICGAATCKTCSSKDLLIYIPDEQNDSSEVQWAIIRIVGCPEKEPSIAMYFRTCRSCSNRLQDIQVARHRVELRNLADDLDTWHKVIEIHDKLADIQANIDIDLAKYQELTDALEISPGSARSLPASRQSNTQTLAKSQDDLNDHFSQFVMIIMNLKKYKPNTHIKSVIFRKIIRSKVDYYQENMYLFRECKKRLEEVTPSEILENIQDFVNMNSLNSSYVCIKQLALECLHLCNKYNIPTTTAEELAALETVVLEDLQRSINQSAESWAEHEEALNSFIELQIKERRLIQPSKTLIKRHGDKYLIALIDKRCQEVLRKVERQFSSRSANRSFRRSKQVINEFLASHTREDNSDSEWEFVSI